MTVTLTFTSNQHEYTETWETTLGTVRLGTMSAPWFSHTLTAEQKEEVLTAIDAAGSQID